jgi:hypothetical protein
VYKIIKINVHVALIGFHNMIRGVVDRQRCIAHAQYSYVAIEFWAGQGGVRRSSRDIEGVPE